MAVERVPRESGNHGDERTENAHGRFVTRDQCDRVWIKRTLASWAAALALAGCRRATPTYSADVAPILAAHCLECHATGLAAGPRFDNYADVSTYAGKIELAVQGRSMPPWLADNTGSCGIWRDARWLLPAEIQTIVDWAEHGRPSGRPGATVPQAPPPQALRVDAIADSGAAFAPTLGPGSHRCFVAQPGLARDRYLTAIRVVSSDPRGVAQVTLYSLETEAAAQAARKLEGAGQGPGYPCLGGARVEGARLLGSWTRGAGVLRFPAGTGVRVPSGRPLILQVHYDLTAPGLQYRTRTRAELELADDVVALRVFPVRARGAPLPPGQRQAAWSAVIDAPPGRVVGVAPRMHTLGTSMRLDRVRGGERTCAASFDHWSFYWQQLFFAKEPLALQPGDALRLSCLFDTRMRAEAVAAGEDASQEQCAAILFIASG